MELLQSIGILDLLFIVILSISVIIGLVRGVIKEVLSLAGLVIAIYLAFTFADTLSSNYVSKFLEDARISYIVTFALIIIGTLFAVTLINLFCSQLLKASGLSLLNRFLGALFGVLRGALICSIIVMVLSFIPGVKGKSWWTQSSLAPMFAELTKATLKYTPQEVRDYFSSAKDSVGNAASEIIIPQPQQTPAQPQEKPQVKTGTAIRPGTDAQTTEVLNSIEQARQATETPKPAQPKKPALPAITLETSTQ